MQSYVTPSTTELGAVSFKSAEKKKKRVCKWTRATGTLGCFLLKNHLSGQNSGNFFTPQWYSDQNLFAFFDHYQNEGLKRSYALSSLEKACDAELSILADAFAHVDWEMRRHPVSIYEFFVVQNRTAGMCI